MLSRAKTGNSSNYCTLNKADAYFDTPLHFCAWLSKRRSTKKANYLLNKEIRRDLDKQRQRIRWRNDPSYRKMKVQQRQMYRRLNIDKTKSYDRMYRKKRRLIPSIRLKMNARSRFGKVMKAIKTVMTTDSFNDFIGCSSAFLKQHIENQFAEWMNWENYGIKWEVDHKKPLKHFDLFNIEQAKKAFNFQNLQPVSVEYNASKQARWTDI